MVTAVTTVGGERLQSQQFAVPASGGTRLLLVATDPAGGAVAAAPPDRPAMPAQPGTVPSAISRDLFSSSATAAFRSSTSCSWSILVRPRHAAASDRLRVPRPWQPERRSSRTRHRRQRRQAARHRCRSVCAWRHERAVRVFDAVLNRQPDHRAVAAGAVGRVIVLAQKMGDMRLASSQLPEQREMPAEGQMYIVGQGPSLRPANVVSLAFTAFRTRRSGLATRHRHRCRDSRRRLVGEQAWQAPLTSAQERLEKRRGQLFNELASLEEQHRAGPPRRAGLCGAAGRARDGPRARLRGNRSPGRVTARAWTLPHSVSPTSRAATEGAGRSAGSRSAARRGRSSASSAPTAPASRRSSQSLRDCCRRQQAGSTTVTWSAARRASTPVHWSRRS